MSWVANLGHSSKCFTCANIFNPPNNQMRKVSLFFPVLGVRKLRLLKYLPKTESVTDRIRI